MAGDFLLDTNIVTAIRRDDAGILSRLDEQTRLYVSSTVAGELYFGAERSSRRTENLTEIEAFLLRVVVLPCDLETAAVYGRSKAALASKGRMIPDNDIWIASVAMQYSLTLVSRDQHMSEVPGLKLAVW
jgi:tRNA(fMet)-specific endonuclease VapC